MNGNNVLNRWTPQAPWHTLKKAFFLYGTLNQSSKVSKPQISIPKIKLPTRIIELAYKPGSKTTIVLTMDNGWAISFRIHSASTIVEPSLKFDIQLLGQPADMFYIDVEW